MASIIDIKLNPTPRDLRVFALLWAAFFVLLGAIAFATETFLRNAGLVTGACVLVSLLVNRDYPRRAQLWGVLIPLVLLGIWGFEHWARASGLAFFDPARRFAIWRVVGDRAAWTVLLAVASVGVLGAIAMPASRSLARRLYRGWMFAALPIGWVVSHVILALVYYLVLTPIGVVMRVFARYDPMRRKFDRSAGTYWLPHEQRAEKGSYFNQF